MREGRTHHMIRDPKGGRPARLASAAQSKPWGDTPPPLAAGRRSTTRGRRRGRRLPNPRRPA
eukprot:15450696-Alexandrium_andersonii.AAC.1